MPQMATKSAAPMANIKMGLQAFLWVTWHCHLDSNLREKRKFFIGLGYSSRQGAKNAKFGNLFCLFAAFASLREIILILVAGAHAKFFVLHTSSQETQNSLKRKPLRGRCPGGGVVTEGVMLAVTSV
jgi:hypothetical protein